MQIEFHSLNIARENQYSQSNFKVCTQSTHMQFFEGFSEDGTIFAPESKMSGIHDENFHPYC
jgi:hypothetical protein